MPSILIIDDEAPLRMLVASALNTKGYTSLEAPNGNTGISLARTHLPDLIICDVMMPDIDGFGVLETLRSDPVTAGIPCILMTGRPDNAGMRQGMTMGADDYLPKPFSIHELLATVETRLKKQLIIKEQAEKKLADLRANITLALPHEFFTPLSGILGFSELLCGDVSQMSAAEIQEMGIAIFSSAKRLYRHIENFVIYAQIELLSNDPQKLDSLRKNYRSNLDAVLRHSCAATAEHFGRAADLVLDLNGAEVPVQDQYLQKIADELCNNAFKFSAAGQCVIVSSWAKDNLAGFSVQDQGHGMTPEHISNIGAYMQFERKFYEQQGSGLGLTIARRLTEIHGGTVKINSRLTLGTNVTISLPRIPSS